MATPTLEGLEAELESLERFRDEAERDGDGEKVAIYEEKIRRVEIEIRNLKTYQKHYS